VLVGAEESGAESVLLKYPPQGMHFGKSRGSRELSTDQEIAEQMEVFSGYLKKNGLKMTRQRELIVDSFLRTNGHLSTDELHQLIKRADKTVGFTTVFRTLKALTDCGLARETDLQDGRTRFEHIYNRPHHHHIVCLACNRTIEFLSPELERLQEQIVAKYQFQSVRHQLQIFGVCFDCQNQRPSPQDVFDSDMVFARDALKIALEAERSGVNFYLAAAEQISQPSGKSTFLRIAEDEKKHLRDLEYEWIELIKKDKNILRAPVFLHFDFEALRKIFPAREEIRKRLKGNLDEEQALSLAMEMELESYNFFRNYAQKFNDTRGKAIFLKFAAEEEDHYRTIQKEYEQLMQRSVH
jgi:Fur family ferric uptake transcriptional regulator